MGLFALAVLSVLSIALWVVGRRFARRWYQVHGTRPPLTWMFRKTDDPALEEPRRFALLLLPFDLLAFVVYFLVPSA